MYRHMCIFINKAFGSPSFAWHLTLSSADPAAVGTGGHGFPACLGHSRAHRPELLVFWALISVPIVFLGVLGEGHLPSEPMWLFFKVEMTPPAVAVRVKWGSRCDSALKVK